jgi:hypothetical protein
VVEGGITGERWEVGSMRRRDEIDQKGTPDWLLLCFVPHCLKRKKEKEKKQERIGKRKKHCNPTTSFLINFFTTAEGEDDLEN